MSATAGKTTQQSTQVVTWFFYIMEFVFATVSGYSESGIYGAYAEHDWTNVWGSIARAAITQIAIVFFGIAAVKAAQNHQKAAVIAANVLTFLFAFVAVWFIHESALINANVSALLPAYNQPVTLFGMTLNGRYVDPWLIASLPLFQVALNWLAPLIVSANQVEVETPEEMDARQKREMLQLQFQQQKAILKAKGRRAQFTALVSKEEEEKPEETATQEEAIDEPIVEEKPRIEAWRVGENKEYWDTKTFTAWVEKKGARVSETKARALLKTAGNETQMVGPGNGWVSHPTDIKHLALQRIKALTPGRVVPFARDNGSDNEAANG